jgi:hypothetical protein
MTQQQLEFERINVGATHRVQPSSCPTRCPAKRHLWLTALCLVGTATLLCVNVSMCNHPPPPPRGDLQGKLPIAR